MSETPWIWRPRPDDLERSHVARLLRRHGIGSTAELRARAAGDPEWFYPAIVEDLGVEWYRRWDRVLDAARGLPHTEWFRGGELNIVHNVLDRHLRDGYGDRQAVVAEDEAGRVERLTYAGLGERVARVASGLRALHVGPGDAVGLYLPMSVDVVVALLACLKIGAAPVPVFAGFGPDALAARLADAGAAVVLADHHVAEALRLCDRAALLLAGEVAVVTGAPDFLGDPLVQKHYASRVPAPG